MSKERVTFTKTATTKAKNPRTWEITYTLVDGPAIKPKKAKRADAEAEAADAAEAQTSPKSRSKRGKAQEAQTRLPV